LQRQTYDLGNYYESPVKKDFYNNLFCQFGRKEVGYGVETHLVEEVFNVVPSTRGTTPSRWYKQVKIFDLAREPVRSKILLIN